MTQYGVNSPISEKEKAIIVRWYSGITYFVFCEIAYILIHTCTTYPRFTRTTIKSSRYLPPTKV
jgi:hypothetical protein